MLGNLEISNHIKLMCSQYYPALNGANLVVNQTQFKECSTYPIVKLDVSLQEDPSQVAASLVVKTAPKSSENIEGLTEYENMAAVKDLFQNLPSNKFGNKAIGLGFVNPLEYNRKLNALVSEFVPHKRLSEKLFVACSHFGDRDISGSVKKDIYTSGAWLRLFHQINDGARKKLGSAGYFHRAEFYIEYANNANINIPSIHNAEVLLNKYKERLSELDLPIGRYHGDFGPQNIGVGNNDGKLYVFDLQRNFDECIYHDIAYFLVTLETLNPYPRHFMFSRSKAQALGKEFLLGYGRDNSEGNEWNDLLFHIYYLLSLLERVRKQCMNRKIEMRGVFSKLLLKKYLNLMFDKKIQREINVVEKLLSN